MPAPARPAPARAEARAAHPHPDGGVDTSSIDGPIHIVDEVFFFLKKKRWPTRAAQICYRLSQCHAYDLFRRKFKEDHAGDIQDRTGGELKGPVHVLRVTSLSSVHTNLNYADATACFAWAIWIP